MYDVNTRYRMSAFIIPRIDTWYQVLMFCSIGFNTWYRVLMSSLHEFNTRYRVLMPSVNGINTWDEVLTTAALESIYRFVLAAILALSSLELTPSVRARTVCSLPCSSHHWMARWKPGWHWSGPVTKMSKSTSCTILSTSV